MTKKLMQEYLVLGGEHHGEVWRGIYPAMGLNLSTQDERNGQFFDRAGERKVTLAGQEQYFISEWCCAEGDSYLLASVEDLATFDIAEEIAQVSPPLRPVSGTVEDWV
ncbi:hypothetical protein [Vagococcus sp. WN89Y]|uniref:hypothetical protein n=1 Tax=Vagococcus sp. WN89Y TaxID=3457258 RepID=UPI003FCCD24F